MGRLRRKRSKRFDPYMIDGGTYLLPDPHRVPVAVAYYPLPKPSLWARFRGWVLSLFG